MLGDKMNVEFNVFNPLLERFTNTYTHSDTEKTTSIEYMQSSSSEGYYLYLFGQEYKKLTPIKLYMKMEFNNAKTGKRTLFFNRGEYDKEDKAIGVQLNNVFFEQNDSRQYMYTEIEVRGVKVKWNNIYKIYEEVTEEGKPFEIKYFWYPIVTNYPKIININNTGSKMTAPFEDKEYPNIEWSHTKPDKLTIKFYEANVN
jgi:hypothetical protein